MTAKLRLRNTAQPITLNFLGGQSFDFTITNDKGAIVYRWPDGQAFTMVFRTETFGPGEIVASAAWKRLQPARSDNSGSVDRRAQCLA